MSEIEKLCKYFERLNTLQAFRFIQRNPEEGCRIIWYLQRRIKDYQKKG